MNKQVSFSDPAGAKIKMAKIVCQKWGDEPEVSLEATLVFYESGIRLRIGNVTAVIRREEIAAAAALWPVKKLWIKQSQN